MKNQITVVDEDGKSVVLSSAISRIVNDGALTNDSEGLFFQRSLEYIQAQSYDVLYPELKGKTIFSTNTEGAEGTEVITYRSYDKRGEAVIVSGKATDLPRADIPDKEYSTVIRTIGTSYGYSRQEIAAAKLTGMPLEGRKADAARRVYEEKCNQLIFFGAPENGLNGLFSGVASDPWSTVSVSQVAGAVGGTNSTVWGVDKTPDEVIADLTKACSDMVVNTKQVHTPNKIIMSIAKRNYMMNTPRSLQSDTSIMNWFLNNNSWITSADQIVAINELDGVYGAVPGLGAGDQGFTVMEDSAENFRLREPFPFVHLPVQYHGFEFEINCYGRFGGLEMIRPAAMSHHYGV